MNLVYIGLLEVEFSIKIHGSGNKATERENEIVFIVFQFFVIFESWRSSCDLHLWLSITSRIRRYAYRSTLQRRHDGQAEYSLYDSPPARKKLVGILCVVLCHSCSVASLVVSLHSGRL